MSEVTHDPGAHPPAKCHTADAFSCGTFDETFDAFFCGTFSSSRRGTFEKCFSQELSNKTRAQRTCGAIR
ncbi:hypothetical protein ACIBG0_37065 [Nocardia sp. NPDC050630]|uniref:hypothetical protein n=1 Tax=Nocardia sp. NPDC050630 TaxID=3364321 RepID=UPI0037A85780